MTKKHFIELADLIREFNSTGPERGSFTSHQISVLGDFCQSQNPRFNRSRWTDYIAGLCGPGGGSVKPKRDENNLPPSDD